MHSFWVFSIIQQSTCFALNCCNFAAGFIRSLSDSQKREQIQKHRESGEWVKAIRLAQASQYSTQEMDDLYISAVNFVAPHAVPVKQGGLKGVPNAIDPEIAQSLSLQWALSISNGEKLADTCLMHCSESFITTFFPCFLKPINFVMQWILPKKSSFDELLFNAFMHYDLIRESNPCFCFQSGCLPWKFWAKWSKLLEMLFFHEPHWSWPTACTKNLEKPAFPSLF